MGLWITLRSHRPCSWSQAKTGLWLMMSYWPMTAQGKGVPWDYFSNPSFAMDAGDTPSRNYAPGLHKRGKSLIMDPGEKVPTEENQEPGVPRRRAGEDVPLD